MSKELWIDTHMELVDERMSAWADAHPDATDAEYRAEEARAYDETADTTNDRYADKIGNMIDAARDRAKYGNL